MTALQGPVFVRTDGSVRGADHPSGPSASVGYVIEENGTQVASGSEDVSDLTGSSNAAEYIALARALGRLRGMGFAGWVFVKTDSRNLVELVNGASPRTSESARWIGEVRSLLAQFEGVSVSKADRAFTAAAHDLATRGHRE
jgi:ribonuclease HI